MVKGQMRGNKEKKKPKAEWNKRKRPVLRHRRSVLGSRTNQLTHRRARRAHRPALAGRDLNRDEGAFQVAARPPAGCSRRLNTGLLTCSGSLAILAAIRRASSRVSTSSEKRLRVYAAAHQAV